MLALTISSTSAAVVSLYALARFAFTYLLVGLARAYASVGVGQPLLASAFLLHADHIIVSNEIIPRPLQQQNNWKRAEVAYSHSPGHHRAQPHRPARPLVA